MSSHRSSGPLPSYDILGQIFLPDVPSRTSLDRRDQPSPSQQTEVLIVQTCLLPGLREKYNILLRRFGTQASSIHCERCDVLPCHEIEVLPEIRSRRSLGSLQHLDVPTSAFNRHYH